MSIHITPGPTPTLTAYIDCPFCEHEAHVVGATQEWYDTIWTCCRCGDAWAGGEMLPRPFARGWRQRAQRRARLDWWDAILAEQTLNQGES